MTVAISYLVNLTIESDEAEPVAVGSALTKLIGNASPLISKVDIAVLSTRPCPQPAAPRVSKVRTGRAGKATAAANGKHPGRKSSGRGSAGARQ
ncbi:MAG: hypothetical protein FWD12_04410 [Alphaproteobacteria bacterium]|nr:hypothetical protein [Alphaproteobacteria bacterium]